MPKSRPLHVLVAGTQLLELLQRTVTKIKVRDIHGTLWMVNGEKRLLTPKEAIALVIKGAYGQFVGETNEHFKRIYFLREFKVDHRPESLWIPDLEFWSGRAILRYQPDRRNIPAKVRNQELEDLWDKMLKANPAPKSWIR